MDTQIIKKEMEAEGTLSVYLKKPEGFIYKAGQSIDLFLINPPETDAEGNKRAYSLSSAPEEDYLKITTRLRDTAFKRVLQKLPDGNPLTLEGPFGDFTLQNNTSRPAVFLIGGVGVTPIRSMIVDATIRNLPHKLFLFYSNRRPEDAVFLTELKELEEKNKNFKLIATMTNMEDSKESWSGETGYINKEMLMKYLPDLNSPIYYMSGPAVMVFAMRKVLSDAGINDNDIRSEEFTGY